MRSELQEPQHSAGLCAELCQWDPVFMHTGRAASHLAGAGGAFCSSGSPAAQCSPCRLLPAPPQGSTGISRPTLDTAGQLPVGPAAFGDSLLCHHGTLTPPGGSAANPRAHCQPGHSWNGDMHGRNGLHRKTS